MLWIGLHLPLLSLETVACLPGFGPADGGPGLPARQRRRPRRRPGCCRRASGDRRRVDQLCAGDRRLPPYRSCRPRAQALGVRPGLKRDRARAGAAAGARAGRRRPRRVGLAGGWLMRRWLLRRWSAWRVAHRVARGAGQPALFRWFRATAATPACGAAAARPPAADSPARRPRRRHAAVPLAALQQRRASLRRSGADHPSARRRADRSAQPAADHRDALQAIGLRQIGELRRLPRSGLARVSANRCSTSSTAHSAVAPIRASRSVACAVRQPARTAGVPIPPSRCCTAPGCC